MGAKKSSALRFVPATGEYFFHPLAPLAHPPRSFHLPTLDWLLSSPAPPPQLQTLAQKPGPCQKMSGKENEKEPSQACPRGPPPQRQPGPPPGVQQCVHRVALRQQLLRGGRRPPRRREGDRPGRARAGRVGKPVRHKGSVGGGVGRTPLSSSRGGGTPPSCTVAQSG